MNSVIELSDEEFVEGVRVEPRKRDTELLAIHPPLLWDKISDSGFYFSPPATDHSPRMIAVSTASPRASVSSFAANEIMYKPLPYRVLVFFYTFLFTPIFGPYYLWIMIKRLIWKTPSPMYEGFFPMYPYDPSEPLTLNRRLFGYAESPQLRQWMDDERQKETAARDAAVVSKNIKQEIITERSK